MAEKTSGGDFLRGMGGAVNAQTLKFIQELFAQQQDLIAPSLALQARGAAQAGDLASAQLSSQLGQLGLGATGVGAIARSVGSQLASNNIVNARLNANLSALQFAGGAGLQQSLALLESFTKIRSAEIGANAGNTGLTQQILGGISSLAAAGSMFHDPSGKTTETPPVA